MPQALVKINGVAGSNTDLPINTIVQLDNQNIGGELTYTWAILDQPPGPNDNLSSTTVQNPTFTPRKEGTYLIRLIVNEALPSEQQDKVVGAVRQIKTRERIIAAGETTEADLIDGWATSNNSYLRSIDELLSDSHVIVGANTSGLSRTAGEVVRVTSFFTTKPGLPGEEKVPGFTLATATTVGQVDELLGIIERGVDGASSIPNNALMRVKMLGTPKDVARVPLAFLGVAVVGDTVFLSDTGVPSLTPGSTRRQIGSVPAIPTAGQYNIWFNGVGGADITPIDPRYVIHGSGGILPNAVRVDGVNATGITGQPFRIRAGDAATVPFQVQAFAGGTDIQQWLSSIGTVLARITNAGQLTLNAEGISIPTPTKNITFGNSGQRVQWTNLYIEQSSATIIGFREIATNKAFRFASDGGTPTIPALVFLEDGTRQVNLELHTDSNGARLNVGTANNLTFATANDNKWQITIGGTLQALGGDRQISNVLDPVLAQDAVTKNYADTQIATNIALQAALKVPENFIINGAFNFWQRGTTLNSIVTATAPGPSGSRAYGPDRWALVATASGGAGSVAINIVRQASAVATSRYMAQMQVQVLGPPTGWSARMDQDIDRDFMYLARGKRVTLQLKLRHTSIPGGNISIQLITGTGSENTPIEGGYTGIGFAINVTQAVTGSFVTYTFTSAGVIPTNTTQFGLRIQMYEGINAGTFNGTLDVAEVILVTAEVAPTEYMFAGGSFANEFTICQRYFEKSYNIDVAPGTNTSAGLFAAAVAQQAAGPIIRVLRPGVEYKVRKRISNPTVLIWGQAAAPGQVFFPATNTSIASDILNISDRGFEINETVPGSYPNTLGHEGRVQWSSNAEI